MFTEKKGNIYKVFMNYVHSKG